MPIPDFVPDIVLVFWTRLCAWFSSQVYAVMLAHAQQHLLVRLHARLDIQALVTACAGYHHTAGPGDQPTHPVAYLVRAVLVKTLYNWSLRECADQINHHLVVKWFVGYPVWAAGPDYTTLARFEQWVSEHHGRTFFDATLRQIDADFPGERRQPQVGDTFALQAHAAKEGLVRLLRHTCQCLLRVLQTADPVAHATVTGQLEAAALFGAPDERAEFYLDAEARRVRLQTTVVAALHCAEVVQAHLAPTLPAAARQPVTDRLADLTKIVADEVALTRDASGAITRVEVRPPKQQGSYRLGSATDPDATYRVHGKDKCDLGYNVNVAVNAHFVREIQAATGAQPDAAGLPDLLTAQQEHHAVVPPQFIYDAAAGEAKTRVLVTQASAGQTQLIAPLRPSPQRHDLGPADCTLSADGLTLTCPNGQTATTAYRSQSAAGRSFRFTAAQCQDCPLWQACRGPKSAPMGASSRAAALPNVAPAAALPNAAPGAALPNIAPAAALPNAAPGAALPNAAPGAALPNAAPAAALPNAAPGAALPNIAPAAAQPGKGTLRQFFISDHRDVLAQARTFNATPEYKAAMQLRPGVERIIAGLTCYNGARRCRCRGLANADYQAKMSAMAFNLKTWLRLLAERDRAGQAAPA
jgi:hypothetical protein